MGLKDQTMPRQAIQVLKPVRVEQKDASASLSPAAAAEYEFEIEFPSKAIGRQNFAFTLTPASFRRDIAPARTTSASSPNWKKACTK